MFGKVLIANRGEIACRVIRTCRRLGIATVAVYSEADRDAAHVEMADEAVLIGPAPARESYLKADRILEAAKATGAEAVHPGYGFLSENDGFAEACAAAGIVFIGPPADAIRAMGSKSAAKRIMEAAGVPLVPGYHGEDQDEALLLAEARRIGWPVLIKATAGGGGKGMRAVMSEAEFAGALAGAKREAASSFGDDRVLIEKYLLTPRHIEIQVFADQSGRAVYLFERDCSIQRRHQKVVEEAPAPGMDPETRAAMGDAAVKAAQAIGYVGAGTVEFIVDASAEGAGAFYFMEMNTRLQVEHPVTEAITGQDLVEWQLKVADGEPLPLAQDQLAIDGHAIEVRLYAEDPDGDFLPATGRLAHLVPPEGEGVRVDSGVRAGDEVSIHYDPMIAKLIVHAPDRGQAIVKLRRALGTYEVAGLKTNLAFLRRVAAHPAFAAAALDTRFIERHRADLLPGPQPASDRVLITAALHRLLVLGGEVSRRAAASTDPHSPWAAADGWRMNAVSHVDDHFRDGEREIEVRVHFRGSDYAVAVGDGPSLPVRATLGDGGRMTLDVDGHRFTARVAGIGARVHVWAADEHAMVERFDPFAFTGDEAAGGGRLVAPMPGKVVQVLVAAGDVVEKGTPMIVLEAMKMEHTIAAPVDGTVDAVHYAAGDLVEDGAELLAFKPTE
ncbi:3-methylcrotonyl-CoA carboxylase subunit alpha [Tistrella bauzanensis]|uniref:3-methylcrotonyl-CoA carboxylase subunit alpha n=1 Tax=Tistrella bauzanensis TaxID=657419 RepID=A0ABQ1IF72_9PROT|nr:acetyl/propionyl/methylcrotonyl-CoA carboxylase subunit alpha [Tistrella bauzanensis]GGB37293.1 3-methylcrotonyl-CoA carboxylase subunit alpha [Tistrella bauzanensis]